MHYHQVQEFERQKSIAKSARASLDDILTVPLLIPTDELRKSAIENALNNHAQGLLGYVVRWVDLGRGASKVPDINNIGLVEDRATLRISSQPICNWLEQSILTERQVRIALEKMAAIVDQQNAHDSAYQPMSADLTRAYLFKPY